MTAIKPLKQPEADAIEAGRLRGTEPDRMATDRSYDTFS